MAKTSSECRMNRLVRYVVDWEKQELYGVYEEDEPARRDQPPYYETKAFKHVKDDIDYWGLGRDESRGMLPTQVNYKLGPETARQIRESASRQGRSVTDWWIEAGREKLAREGHGPRSHNGHR